MFKKMSCNKVILVDGMSAWICHKVKKVRIKLCFNTWFPLKPRGVATVLLSAVPSLKMKLKERHGPATITVGFGRLPYILLS